MSLTQQGTIVLLWPSPCGGKVDGLDGAVSAGLLALEQQVHQLHTLTLNKRGPGSSSSSSSSSKVINENIREAAAACLPPASIPAPGQPHTAAAWRPVVA
jgi:hypothetical protein